MWVSSKSVGPFLERLHYLGPVQRGFCWSDEYGVAVLAKPTSRRLPQDGTWLELVRWCLLGERNGGSRQWAQITKALRHLLPELTTVVSYSDPAQGHTGAFYKACNWQWRPTWHRLRPPPSGNGSWDGNAAQGVKDRWAYFLRPDARRDGLLAVQDAAIVRAGYSAPQVRAQPRGSERMGTQTVIGATTPGSAVLVESRRMGTAAV